MKYPKNKQLKLGTSYQGIAYKLVYLFEDLKYFNCFVFIEDFDICLKAGFSLDFFIWGTSCPLWFSI